MAFVFRSPRVTNLSQIQSNADSCIKEIKNNNSIMNSSNSIKSNKNFSQKIGKIKAPFGIKTKKTLLHNINIKEITPGPGSYELQTDFIKNKFNTNKTSPDDDISPNEKNKRLFISKKDRLDKNQYETDVPGPGKYYPDSNKKKFNIYNTLSKKSNWIKPEKTINYEPFSTSRILSIPSKGIDFGYEYNKKGSLILIEDPAKDIKFSGTKNNSVGPGQYNSETYDKKNNKISILDWNKSLSTTHSKKLSEDKKNNISNNLNNLSQYESSNYFFCNNTTEPTTNNNSISIINFNKKNRTKNYFYNGWDIDKKNFEIKFSNNKIYKNDNFAKTINKSNISPFFKTDTKPTNTYLTNETETRVSDNYFSTNYFSPKTVSETNQFFGSTLSRGIMYPKIKGNTINKFGTNILNTYNNKIDKNEILSSTLNISSGLNSSIKKINDSKSENKKNKIIIQKIDKADLIREISKSLKKENISKLGPGCYEPKFIPKNNFSYEIGNFGSLERRFPLYKKSNQENGGVLSYLYLDNWGPKQRTNYRKKVMPQNILKKLNEGISINKMTLFRDKIMEETRKQPPLGSYDVEKVNTIESKVKNAANTSRNLPAFGTSGKRVLFDSQIKKGDYIGNDYYSKEENNWIKKEKRQNYVPFLSNTGRDDVENFEKDRLTNIGGQIGGPGYYKTDSYFDWNKKSYNILFN